MWVQSLGQEDPLEEGMATHSSILARKIPWTEEPGRLQSMGLQKSGTRLNKNSAVLQESRTQPEVTVLYLGGGFSSCSRTQRDVVTYIPRRSQDPAAQLFLACSSFVSVFPPFPK